MTNESKHATSSMAYLPGLDGLRALAVVAVVLYHAGLDVVGGYLGVEVFFALSGFLITALLFAEWRTFQRVDLGAFWKRRARRLLPALGLVIGGALAFAALALPEELNSVVNNALAATAYVINWQLIASGQSYFDPMERPPLLQHLWSLAVEEQFYVIWPILFVVGMRLLRRWGLLLATLLGAAASTVAMWLMYEPGVDPTRLYYGTDTRASGLLLGAALALAWVPGQLPGAQSRTAGRLLSGLGIAALAGLTAAFFIMDAGHPWLYQGGFLAVSMLTLLAIMAVTHPQTPRLTSAMSWKPLRWIGVRSYSIYLWHWPVFSVTRPDIDVTLNGWILFVVRVAIVIALADLSYRCVEVPVRQGALGRLWQRVSGWLRVPQFGPALATEAGSPGVQAIVQRGPHMYAAHGPRRRWTKAPVRPRLPRVRLAGWRSTMARRVAASSMPGALRWHNLLMCGVLLVSTATCASTSSVPILPVAHSDGIELSTVPGPTSALERAATAPDSAPESDMSETPTLADTDSDATAATPAPSADDSAAQRPVAEQSAAEQLPPIDAELAASLQNVLDQTVADGYIPGASVAVSIPGYATWTGTSGVASRSDERPLTTDTPMRIGSLSKMFTSVVVMQLVDEGKIGFDEPLSTWFPEIVPNADDITVRMLLQHTSGLYDYLEDSEFVAEAYADPERMWEPQELVAYAADKRTSFSPGVEGRWDYSSTNYVLLGMIVEKVTGHSMAQEERSRIFEPLQLNATYFTPFEEVAGQLADGYSRSRSQSEVAMSFGFATANVVSTPGDLARFGNALFDGKLLKPETMNQMLSFVGGKGSYNMPDLEYGLGMMRNVLPVDGSDDDSTVIGHIGGFGGFRSALWHSPASGITIALDVNQASTDPNTLATDIWATILEAQAE